MNSLSLFEIETYIQSLPAYSNLSKQNKLDLHEYLVNSNYAHHGAILFKLRNETSISQHVEMLLTYIEDVENKRYRENTSIFFEDFYQTKQNVVIAKPCYSTLIYSFEYNDFYLEGTQLIFITENLQYLVFSKSDYEKDTWNLLNSINDWKTFTFLAKFNCYESMFIRVGTLIYVN